jgi:O-antigen ligase
VSLRLRGLLVESPSLPLLLIAVAVFVWLAADEGGFHGTTFLPATLLLLALLLVGLLALPLPRPTRSQWAAIALLAGYAAWSYLSILWADEQGLAWDGANRTLMYAIVFTLFALWAIRGDAAAVALGLYTLCIAGLGLIELLRAEGSDSAIAFFDEGRLSEPTGYANANVALWSTALWPAIVLAGRRQVPAGLRGLFLGSAGLLAALSILGQSRSWAVTLPLTALLLVAVVPGRGRTIAAGALVAVGIAAIARPLLDVYESVSSGSTPSEALPSAVDATLVVSALLLAAGTTWGLLEGRERASGEGARRLGAVIVAGFLVCCLGGLVAFTAARGNPVTEATDAWHEFKRGGSEGHFDGSRIGSLGGTYRYDYWEVAWRSFEQSPLIGVGVDNFGRDYLIHGKSQQTPTYPHSVELRTLSQTGLVGALLLLGAIAAAIVATTARIRGSTGIGGATAAASVVAFGYFVLHGSLDWLWEFPGLGAPAFGLLGLATAIGGRVVGAPREGRPSLPALAAGAAVSLAIVASVGLPWLAERELRGAREIAATDPSAALAKLDKASDLNPLSPLADKTAAVIERRQGRLGTAERRLRGTLARDPGDPFVFLQLAVIASATDRMPEAVRLIRRARTLNPRDSVTRRVQRQLEAGRYVSPARVDELIVEDVNTRTGRD